MKNEIEKQGVVQVSAKLKPKDYDALKKLSATTSTPMAEIIRGYILKGMHADKTREDIDFIRKNIREELHSVLEGYMNRIIKLNIKIGIMTVSMCYFTSKLTYVLIARYKDNLNYDEMMDKSKKEASAFLGLKDASVDELCKNILGKSGDL